LSWQGEWKKMRSMNDCSIAGAAGITSLRIGNGRLIGKVSTDSPLFHAPLVR
jgi:hypothetical protein